MEASRFERDTAVERVGDGRYRGEIDAGWEVLGGHAPNGGYLVALAARAMRDPLPHPDPVTLTSHFVTPAEPGPVDVEVEVVRGGRRHSTVAARVVQGGHERLRLLATFADLRAAEGPTRVDRSPPDLPGVEDCVDVLDRWRELSRGGGLTVPPILERFDHRMPESMIGWAVGRPLGRGEIGGHVRWADDDRVDTLGVLAITDCYPPAVFNTGESSTGWAPTIELTVQVRTRPSAGYLATRFTTTAVTTGYLEEDGEIWDADGDLVALSRQLALAPR